MSNVILVDFRPRPKLPCWELPLGPAEIEAIERLVRPARDIASAEQIMELVEKVDRVTKVIDLEARKADRR